MSVVKVGLLGLGTVGTGVYETVRTQAEKLEQRLGKKVEIVKILVHDVHKERDIEVPAHVLTNSFAEVMQDKPDVLIEVMGGIHPAYEYIEQAFQNGCHVVTANKELLAKHGPELHQKSNTYGVHFYYEASVAGGIPILNAIRHLLKTNDIKRMEGILNGTTNFILTQMEQHGRTYEEVLAQAQELGYAEADPTADVEGYDALYKTYILAQLMFGRAPHVDQVQTKGIQSITLTDIHLAQQLGYRFKLLSVVEEERGSIRLQVEPVLLPFHHLLAQVDGEDNAIQITGNIVGDLYFAGKGAGALPTASAIIEDMVYLLNQPFHDQHIQVWEEQPEAFSRVGTENSHQCLIIPATEKNVSFYHAVSLTLQEQQVDVLKAEHVTVGEDMYAAFVVRGLTEEKRQNIEAQHRIQCNSFLVLDASLTEQPSSSDKTEAI